MATFLSGSVVSERGAVLDGTSVQLGALVHLESLNAIATELRGFEGKAGVPRLNLIGRSLARTHSASSRGSGASFPSCNPVHTSNSSRRYRRVAHSPQVDDTLFGEKHSVKTRKYDRTLQVGSVGWSKCRDIVGGNKEHDSQSHMEENSSQRQSRRAEKPAPTQKTIVAVVGGDLRRTKHETKIYTAADLEQLEEQREAELEKQRLSAKARKVHMMRLSKEAALRAPKSEIEQIFDAEKKETLRRASALKDQTHDTVKLMKTLGARAQAFTIRDQQLKVKEHIEEDHHVYNEKMNVLMEIERLEGLKRQEAIDESKKAKRIADRKALEDQITEHKRQRERENEQTEQEAREMLAKIKQQQGGEVAKEKRKTECAQRTMDEVRRFNDDTQARKLEMQRKIKEEDERIAAYQLKKADDMRRLEEEEAQRRHVAELRTAKLLSMQEEKMANKEAELGELRAKRAAEARERQAREADLALARKQKIEMGELRRAREAQAMHRQCARINEAALQKQEYESIMMQVETKKSDVKLSDEKRKLASLEHRKALQEQVKEKLKNVAFARKQEESQALKREYAE